MGTNATTTAAGTAQSANENTLDCNAGDRTRLTVEGHEWLRIYQPTEKRPYYQLSWKEQGKRRTTSAGRTLEELQLKAAGIIERVSTQAFKSDHTLCRLAEAWLDEDRPRRYPWSAKHRKTQASLIRRFIAPAAGHVPCGALERADLQRAVNAAPTHGEGARVLKTIRAILNWGYTHQFLTRDPRILTADVYWTSSDPDRWDSTTEASKGLSAIDLGMVPEPAGIKALGDALDAQSELMMYLAAYSGLRLGELLALTPADVDTAKRHVSVKRQIVEVDGVKITRPKWRKSRVTFYLATTPEGYALADKLREQVARVTAKSGRDGILFPRPRGSYWTPSAFGERRFRPAARRACWPTIDNGKEHGKLVWTWHGLRHRFACYLLWERDASPADVSAVMGHASVTTTLKIYGSRVTGSLDRLTAL